MFVSVPSLLLRVCNYYVHQKKLGCVNIRASLCCNCTSYYALLTPSKNAAAQLLSISIFPPVSSSSFTQVELLSLAMAMGVAKGPFVLFGLLMSPRPNEEPIVDGNGRRYGTVVVFCSLEMSSSAAGPGCTLPFSGSSIRCITTGSVNS